MFVKGYVIYMSKNICKNISKSLIGKYSQKVLDHAKQSATDGLKTASKRTMQKTTKGTVDSIGHKIVDKNAIVSRKSPQKSSGRVTNGDFSYAK